MEFSPVVINGFTFTNVKENKDKLALRKFFTQHYDAIAEDVFPDEDFAEYYNSLIVKVTDSSGKIVGGLLSCAPPLLANQAFKQPTQGALNRIKRLTFLDLIAVDEDNEELYPLLLEFYIKISQKNGLKTIIGFTSEFSYLSSQLDAADFAVLQPNQPAPLLQGINWELPLNEPKETTVWFYKVL
jgi:hypothetical protein